MLSEASLINARIRIAQRIALELRDGMTVNLGVGIPSLIPNYLHPEQNVFLHCENGILGMGDFPDETQRDMDLINASKQPVTLNAGASIFSSADAFAMIRGGHIDVSIMGALQVSEHGEIANWSVPGKDILGVGGAMDLVANARRLIIAIGHTAKDGSPKLVDRLSYPTSGIRHAQMVVTEKAVFVWKDGKMYLQEIAADSSLEDIKRTTTAHFEVARDVREMANCL